MKYNFLSAFFAFVLWGGWALYINSAQVMSGIAQGIASFLITLLIAIAVEKQYRFFKSPVLKLICPPVLTILFTTTCLVIIHHLIHTPQILKTILPASTVAFLFACLTTYKIHKASHGK